MNLTIGEQAPDFTLLDQDGVPHTLSSHKGEYILIYFYPKDDTPGCTKEACSFRDNFPKFQDTSLKVFGISADSEKSHKKFALKYNLPFTLLADSDKKVVTAYGAASVLGVKRISYLINPEGMIIKFYEKVKPDSHAEEVLKDVELAKKA
jgi:peroxiredoxin Q/BCP